MARVEVLESECDNCHTTQESPMPASRRAKLILPKGWMHIQADTADVMIFELDLCPKCGKGVRDAVGKGDKK